MHHYAMHFPHFQPQPLCLLLAPFHVSIAGSRGMSDVQFRKTATTGPWMVVWTQELNQQSATSIFSNEKNQGCINGAVKCLVYTNDN